MSARSRQENNQLYDDINITPMLDLAYVLLVTFIILTTAAVQGVRVNSPLTQRRATISASPRRARSRSPRTVRYSSMPTRSRMRAAAASLAQYKAANPNLPVVLKGDSAANYQTIMDVLEVAKKLNITEIGIVTKREQP